MSEARRTFPWHAGEYVYINGHPMVYSTIKDEMIVRFPGRGSVSVNTLLTAGHMVVMPEMMRCSDAA